ncbi:MAG: HK97 gp10 family phage protein [Propionivibrio sp.]
MLTFDKNELQALSDRLKTMADKTGKAAARKAAGKAMLPVRQDAKANAPYDPADDGKHIRTDVAMRGRWRGDTLVLRVGVKGGAKKNPDSPFYWRFPEFGSKHMPAKSFLAPALESNQQEVLDTLAAELKKGLGL